jgi:phosphohistidine phosphatase SixA
MNRSLLALLLLTLGGLFLRQERPSDPAAAAPPAPVTVFCLRHAEKGAGEPDPVLSEAGAARAAALARLLGAAGVTHLFASEYQRTRQTLAPLAAARGLEVTVVSARDLPQQVQQLHALPPGAVAVVAGHSNTVPALVEALGGRIENLEPHPQGPRLGEEQYDRLFAVTRLAAGGPVSTLELRYGESQAP